MKNVFKLPISEHFSSSGDSGRCVNNCIQYDFALTCDLTLPGCSPFVLSGLSLEEEKIYDSLATTVSDEFVDKSGLPFITG